MTLLDFETERARDEALQKYLSVESLGEDGRRHLEQLKSIESSADWTSFSVEKRPGGRNCSFSVMYDQKTELYYCKGVIYLEISPEEALQLFVNPRYTKVVNPLCKSVNLLGDSMPSFLKDYLSFDTNELDSLSGTDSTKGGSQDSTESGGYSSSKGEKNQIKTKSCKGKKAEKKNKIGNSKNKNDGIADAENNEEKRSALAKILKDEREMALKVVIRGVWPVNDRELLFRTLNIYDATTRTVYNLNFADDKLEQAFPEVKKGRVRGTMHIGGFIVKGVTQSKNPVEREVSEVAYYIKADPKGWIPKVVLQFLNSSQVKMVLNLEKKFEEEKLNYKFGRKVDPGIGRILKMRELCLLNSLEITDKPSASNGH